ncbi:MAG TPA: PilC/PilY family type IV pilus protein [Humisphaera sp.]
MKRKLAVLLVAAAVAGAVLLPVHLLADIASCSVNASSYADAVINPPGSEDTEFFVTTGGVPNIMLVLDTSWTMRRLAPDGAATSWGSFGGTYGCTNTWANTRVFASPCGTTTFDGLPFNPSPGATPPDFAQAKDLSGKYCPYMVSGNQPPATNQPGFDPDFYGGGGGNPWFFERDKVYHDAVLLPQGVDGWTDWSTNPAPYTTYGDFCNQWSSDAAKAASCAACMRDQGYFFDGSYLASWAGIACGGTADCTAKKAGTCVKDGTSSEYSGTNDGTAHCRLPNVWFSGNFLNFDPPKFIVARKVLKDVLQNVRKVRLGLTVFDASGNGGVLLQALNPGCNLIGSPSSFDSNRGSILSAINSKNQVTFTGFAPIAETLLDVAHLYLSANVTPAPTWFTSAYQDSGFTEKSGQNVSVCFSCQASTALVITDGVSSNDGNIPGPAFAANPMTLTVANAAGSIAGMAGYNVTGISSTDCPTCNTAAEAADTSVTPGTCFGQQSTGSCDEANNPIPSYLPKVAWYLKNLDFRPDAEIGSDGMKMAKKQSITTYTIGLGAPRTSTAAAILDDTAQAGGGLYNGGTGSDVNDAKTLRDAILKVFDDVNTRSTSFGAASLSTLQIASTQGVLIPRFEPSRSAHWHGHLYSFDLYSEFASGCRPVVPASASGPANGDYDCDGSCGSVFLKDADGDFIQEDANGAFKKNLTRTLAPCAGSKCSAANCSEPDPNAPAKPYWDAGSKLAPVATSIDPVSGIAIDSVNPDFKTEWTNRKIYTAIDRNGDGKIDRFDEVGTDGALVELTAANAATLAPYLNLKGTRYCQKLSTRLSSRGNPMGATIDGQLASGDYTGCAEILIDFVRGADVFNERGCSGYPTSYCSRKYQLGDIFHSSPVEVLPPFTSTSWYCVHGAHAQCLASLYSSTIPNPSTASPANANAYDDYAKSTRYKSRKKFAIVGANDGLLHAFRIERSDPQAGEEIWAFVPPDLLPKLRMLTEGVHQFYVDATAMVRDVWMDGVPNGNSTLATAAADGVRQGREFHTVAVVGERRGGTHYFALDVTDASSDLDAKPRFLWVYPQPNDPESLSFGETYSEFLPKAPPIGPVKIDAGPQPCALPASADPDGSSRCFQERWIAFLSGGFDPQYTKGRGVHMVALDTGAEIWDFSQAGPQGTYTWGGASTCDATKDPRCHLNYPVAATVGMVMWGSQPAAIYAGAMSYFDTATFGDTGGQLWTLRFATPGVIDPTTNKVNNWFGARSFQHGLNTSSLACGLGYCDSQPFFYITSNVALAANGLYRTLDGTGDRFNVLDPIGGTCGPDNIRACLLKGCTVTLADAAGGPGAVYGVEPLLGTQSYSATLPAYCASVDPTKFGYAATGGSPGGACTTVTSRVQGVTITCPSTNTCSGKDETTSKNASVTCTSDSCDDTASNTFGVPIDMKGNPDKRNWFFSVRVFDRTGDRSIFSDLAGALKYDAARFKGGDLKNVNAADTDPSPSNLAGPEDAGWSYYFDHGSPSTKTASVIKIAGVDHNIYRTDERTASVSDVQYGCAFWNTIQTGIPVGAVDSTTSCPVASPCKAGRAQVAYLYGANAGTGANCLKVDGVYTRVQQSEVIAPPQMGKLVLFVGDNQVMPGLTKTDPGRGANSVPLAEPQDIAASTEWLPIDRSAHACRHSPKETQTGVFTAQPTDAACRQE